MTFDEWWATLLPAEVDELKPVFQDCWNAAQRGFAVGLIHHGETRHHTALRYIREGGNPAIFHRRKGKR